jgi:hypothetical protein
MGGKARLPSLYEMDLSFHKFQGLKYTFLSLKDVVVSQML